MLYMFHFLFHPRNKLFASSPALLFFSGKACTAYDTGRKEVHRMPMMPSPCKRDSLPGVCLWGGMDDALDMIDRHSADF